MQIDREGRETVYWDLTEAPATGGLEVTFDRDTWHTLTREGDTVSLLIAGPDATANPVGTIVLGLGRHFALIRSTVNPEVLVRQAGPIDVGTYQPPPTPTP